MISLEAYKKICKTKKQTGFTCVRENEFMVIDLGTQDETLIEVIYQLGLIANHTINQDCYINKDHLPYIAIIYKLMKKDHFILAIDGMCGSGKSTLAKILEKIMNVQVFCIDDFYLPNIKRTQARLSQPGGHIDYERFIETVLKPISLKQKVYYQPYSCLSHQLVDEITVIDYQDKIIVEGSYSLNPLLVSYYTDKVVLRISSQQQSERLTKRNPEVIKDFEDKWIPLENKYFADYHIFEIYKVIDID